MEELTERELGRIESFEAKADDGERVLLDIVKKQRSMVRERNDKIEELQKEIVYLQSNHDIFNNTNRELRDPQFQNLDLRTRTYLQALAWYLKMANKSYDEWHVLPMKTALFELGGCVKATERDSRIELMEYGLVVAVGTTKGIGYKFPSIRPMNPILVEKLLEFIDAKDKSPTKVFKESELYVLDELIEKHAHDPSGKHKSKDMKNIFPPVEKRSGDDRRTEKSRSS